MSEYKQTVSIAGKDVTVETGVLADLANGKVKITMGGTVIFATATVDDKDTDLDYFPLSVEYIEKMYARGAISGSRFRKREGLPSDEAIIKAREVDHSIRSLFPKSWKKPVSVVLTVLAYDGQNDPQALTVFGASLALLQSGVPFAGPASSVVVGVSTDNSIELNPYAQGREDLAGEFIVSGVDGKILSFEGWGKELSDETMDTVLDKANDEIVRMNQFQREFVEKVGVSLNIDENEYDNKPAPKEVIEYVDSSIGAQIKDALFGDKLSRNKKIDSLKAEIKEKISSDESLADNESFTSLNIYAAVEYVSRKYLREAVLKEDKRVSGRNLDEIRELKAHIDELPTVHGSAVFSRGLTQSLSIVTLAPKSAELLVDDMEGEDSKSFMHHYNFPPFSTGEAGRYRYHPGRREIGHGAIGENALKNIIPNTDDFPYTIRVVSEIMSSNGSTSMAATCASSMALMAAGVPMKEQVAGIGVGLVTEDGNEDNYKLILDIEGIEDFYGDMDFKVCGTKNGVTAIQYENKLQGVKLDVLKKSFRLAKEGRMHVLEAMNAVISEPKSQMADNAPKVEEIKIKQDQIGELIGPGGKNIKELVELSKDHGVAPADISIDDDGTVFVTAYNADQLGFVKNSIAEMFKKAEVGEIYEGVIDKVMNFGAFVNVSKSITGLIHVSELSPEGKFIKDATEVIESGTPVRVKCIKIDDRTGKTSFSMKGIDQNPS
jgi:polyribonucleotide nucleotidyltransferase